MIEKGIGWSRGLFTPTFLLSFYCSNFPGENKCRAFSTFPFDPNTTDPLPASASECCRCAEKIMKRQRLQCKEVCIDPDSGNKQPALNTCDLCELFDYSVDQQTPLPDTCPFLKWDFILKNQPDWLKSSIFASLFCSEQRLWCCWGGRKQPAAASVPVCCLHRRQKNSSRGLKDAAWIYEESAAGGRWDRDEEEEREKVIPLSLQELTQTIEAVYIWVEGCL